MEMKKGFKMTEVGAIPVDWEVKPLSDLVDFLDGQRRPIKSSERKPGVYPYYGASGIIDYVDDFIFDDKLILLGEDGENILSRNLPLAFMIEGKVWVNNHAHVLKPKDTADIKFLTDYLESLDYSLLNSGTAQPKLNKQACLNIKIVLPPLPEQTAIATTLSDMDALIAQTEKLLQKKKAVKQGLMQELLRPKEGWVVRRLGEVGDVKMCRRVFNYETEQVGSIPFYKIGTFGKEADAFISEELYQNYRQKFSFPKKGDILISAAGTIGRTIIYDGKPAYFQDSNIVWIDNNETLISNKFLYYVLQIVKYNTEGGTIQRLYNSILRSAEFICPNLETQTRITRILSDADAEIQALETKIAKLKAQKQGMMQALLTGKIRLTA